MSAETKVCGRCKAAKPLDEFYVRRWKSGNVGRMSKCRACVAELNRIYMASERGRVANRAASRRHVQKLRALSKAAVLTERDPMKLDVLRRVLAEHPPGLSSEEELVAYFRGFMAGAQRNAHESERFERLKDLAHRIAAEKSRFYEERLSAAYEGLLMFARRNPTGGFKSAEDERRLAARAIRAWIIDVVRATGPIKKHGGRRYDTYTLTDVASGDGKSVSDMCVDRTAAPVSHALDGLILTSQTRTVLDRLAAGERPTEIARSMKLSSSRISQLIREVREGHPELAEVLSA